MQCRTEYISRSHRLHKTGSVRLDVGLECLHNDFRYRLVGLFRKSKSHLLNDALVPSKDLKKSIMALKEMRKKVVLKNKAAIPSKKKKSNVVVPIDAKKKKKTKIVIKKKRQKIKVVKKKRKLFPSARVAPE